MNTFSTFYSMDEEQQLVFPNNQSTSFQSLQEQNLPTPTIEDLDIMLELFEDNEDHFDLNIDNILSLDCFVEDTYADITVGQTGLVALSEEEFNNYLSRLGIGTKKRVGLVELRKKCQSYLQKVSLSLGETMRKQVARCERTNSITTQQLVQYKVATSASEIDDIVEKFLHQAILRSTINKIPSNNRHIDRENKRILFQWFMDHLQNPYPTDSDLILLNQSTRLDSRKIRAWFTNMRGRYWKPMLEQNGIQQQSLCK